MGLTELSIAHAKAFTTNTDHWGVSMVFTAPTSETATVDGLHVRHNTQYDQETGALVSGRNASVTVSESVLTDAGYPVRNGDDDVHLANHRVSVADSTGTTREYVVREWFPDEKLGIIVCILGDFA